MKLTIQRDDLVVALTTATRACSTRSAIAVLSGVRIAGTTIEATDRDLGLQVECLASEVAGAPAVVPGRLLLSVVRSLPAGEVTLAEVGNMVEVAGGRTRAELRTLPIEDWPSLPDPPGGDSVSVPADVFLDLANTVAPAAAKDDKRPHLTNVLVSGDGSTLRMVATDSYRMAIREVALGGVSLDTRIPARALTELQRVAGGSEKIDIVSRENQIIFRAGDVVLSSCLNAERFPKWEDLVPDTYEYELRVSREELLEAVRRVGTVAGEKTPVRLAFSKGSLGVTVQTPDVGRASETVPVPFQGEPLEIGFLPEFFRGGLEVAQSDEVTLSLTTPLKPALITDEGIGLRYLVMPRRLD